MNSDFIQEIIAGLAALMPICDLGCGVRDWLIVTGPEAGHIWRDHAPDQLGIEPVVGNGRTRTTFAEWYLDWIHASLSEC